MSRRIRGDLWIWTGGVTHVIDGTPGVQVTTHDSLEDTHTFIVTQ